MLPVGAVNAFAVGPALGSRFAQSTFIVYLPAGGAVKAGYNGRGAANDLFGQDADGTQTYFSISMLNKTFA
jgi:hypothetical protein